MRPRSIWFCTAALFLCALPAMMPAQQPASDKYAAEPLVIDRSDIVYAMNADGTGYMQKTVAVKIQSQSALQQLGIIGMGFAANSQHVEFHYVRVRRPDGSVTETPLSGVLEQPIQATVQAPFYSDLKIAQIPVKNLQVGDTLEWEARTVFTKAEAPNEFWGAENIVTEDAVVRQETVELRFPASKSVTVWTNPVLGVTPKESKDGDWKVYRWETSALKPTVGAEADAAKEAKKKHVLTAAEELDEERGKLPSVSWTTFPSWAAVGEWYRSLELPRATPDDEIKAKVAELTAGKTTDEDKVRAIYEYVSTQVRYIGVAFGVGRYQPHQAVDVLHNQYGDCKDKATLLSAMLAAAGIQSDAALIGAGFRFNDAVPSPGWFNHLITHLRLNGQDVWLDSTEEVAPYRMMYAVLRDHEALVVPPTGTPVIEKTPKDPPFAAYQTWTAKGTLDTNGISDSQITVMERGDDELQLRAVVRQLGPAQYDEFAQRLLGMLGYGGTESHVEFSRTDTVDEPFKMSFDYHREKAGDWDNLKIIPQLAPLTLPAVDDSKPVTQAIRLGTPRTESSTAEIKLPAGWTAELPEAVHEKSAYATYDLTYRFDKGTLYSERKLVVLQSKVPVADWKTYKKFADSVGVGNEGYVQLRRANGGVIAIAPASPRNLSIPTTAQAIDPKATPSALVQQAIEAGRHWDYVDAQALLGRARELNPKERHLWSTYGAVALGYGKASEAIEDYRKELSNYPDSYDVYALLANAQRMRNDKAGLKETLRTWTKGDASNPKPLTALAELEYADKEYEDARTNSERALALEPDNQNLQLLAGESELRTRSTQKGTERLKSLLQTTDDPLMMNDAAYELADAGQELPLDETKEQAAIEKLTAESQSWTLDESMQTLRGKSSLLVASWDTMGWILYREGKSKEAKSYIEAAWWNNPKTDLKEHLDKVNAALGVTTPSRPKLPAADVIVTAGGIGQEARTFPLGPAQGRHGVAEYRILLSHGKVERVEATGEKTIEGAEAMVKGIDMAKMFPDGSEAKLVRAGMVNCFADKCTLVLEP